MRMFKRLSIVIIFCLLMSTSMIGAAQQIYPGAGLFTFECRSNGISFNYQNSSLIFAGFDRIVPALNIAVAQQENQPIAFTTYLGVWALKSNEIQVHVNDRISESLLVLPADVCPIPAGLTGGSVNGVALTYAASGENGSALSFAGVTNDGQAFAYAQSTGDGVAVAYAQVQVLPDGSHVHVVRPGENLFRISLRYQTTVAAISLANNITNPDLIYVGQRLIIP